MSSESLSSHHRRSQTTKDSQFRIADFASALATKNKKNGKENVVACKDRPSEAKSLEQHQNSTF